jgi:hypothetical protein
MPPSRPAKLTKYRKLRKMLKTSKGRKMVMKPLDQTKRRKNLEKMRKMKAAALHKTKKSEPSRPVSPGSSINHNTQEPTAPPPELSGNGGYSEATEGIRSDVRPLLPALLTRQAHQILRFVFNGILANGLAQVRRFPRLR